MAQTSSQATINDTGDVDSPPKIPRFKDETWWYGPAAMLVFLLGWELGVSFSGIPELFLPRPSVVLRTLAEQFASKGLLYDMVLTLTRIFGGFLLASVVGIGIGILMGTSRRIYAIADIFVATLYPVPKISLIPLLVIWLGSGELFLVVLCALGCVFPVLVNTIYGVRQVDEGLVLAARDLGATPMQIQRKIVLPAAVPSIFAGLRIALGIGIIMVVAAEMQTARYGLGAKLFAAGQILETGEVFAILLLLAAIGLTLTKIQQRLDNIVSRWRTR
ncbi:ABC transporter permease [Roseomonas sp. KE2513]|uniref:ABC transporter permease n=1 Tax=Roseomonas sp. KE2513 TaxID=2479202 RepID=UPI0018E02C49|nr:ABC transporter permease [Roseomonas sp. KE2513]MBI0539228.1 ABC transporter permease [Roseomonas sp. KE2513]